MLKKLFKIFVTLVVLSGLAVAGALYWLIAVQPGEAISRDNLKKVLAVESPVYYRDGTNKIGVFFQDAHRQYLAFDKIPKNFVHAIVAAEDQKFFRHFGFDPVGITRAMIANLKARRVVQGGSTITQQAAKNLFKRQDRSVKEKLKELLFALRLEYHYSKEKILEFYVNQFYVSGNGRGLGVAARYFFDKPVGELDLLECAFIAGSVKRPNYYNPFLSRNRQTVDKARQRAKGRAGYVLDRMLELGYIDGRQYQEVMDREVPFRQGRMSYALNTVMDLVKEALAEPEVEEAFVRFGIDNVATSGVRIISTVEKNIQQAAFYGLRKELSRLAVRLEGYDNKVLNPDLKIGNGLVKPKEGDFLFGRVAEVVTGPEPSITVVLGKAAHGRPGSETIGTIDRDGLSTVLDSQAKFERTAWSTSSQEDLDKLLAGLAKGDPVYVSVRQVDRGDDLSKRQYLLDLEQYPKVQGGVLVLREGKILAMVGGHENRFYNRAISARRLMGSVAKPLLYAAAMQLGWSSADLLNNERNGFYYQKQSYFPRPDHISPYSGVSLNWAGVKSENVASVWLLYHLCDRLTPGQFKDMLQHLGLGRGADESYSSYRARIRDKYGIRVNNQQLSGLAFVKAVDMIGPDLAFDGRVKEFDALRTYHYRLEDELDEEELKPAELKVRMEILKRTYPRLDQAADGLMLLRAMVEEKNGEDVFEGIGQNWESGARIEDLYWRADTDQVAYGSYPVDQEEEWWLLDRQELEERLQGMNEGRRHQFWESVLLDGLVSLGSFRMLAEAMEQEFGKLAALPAYGPEILHQVRDFRVMASLHYLMAFCQRLGIRSPMEPVLSFPLGSNVITLLDLARAYESVVTGVREGAGRATAGESLMIIERIESSDGEIIYRPGQTAEQVVDRQTSAAVADILANVVTQGTGRYASANLRLDSRDPERSSTLTNLDLRVPVLGKTGTANQFRNSAFAGYVPAPVAGRNGLGLEGGYALAAYVGYDDNDPMVKGTTRISGSSGALPVWTWVAEAILRAKEYDASMDLEELAFLPRPEIPLHYPEVGPVYLFNDQDSEINRVEHGLKISYSKISPSVRYGSPMRVFAELGEQGLLKPHRYYRPFWVSDSLN